MAVLAEADRLATLAELVGLGSLPPHERMTMLAGRLLRHGVLQQNALSPTDAFCGPRKSAALVDAVLAVADRCRELVDAGTPAAVIEEVDFGPLVRAREQAAPDDADAVRREAATLDLNGGGEP
jgi:V/A-type H+-transporting ATPase subunit A